MYLLNFFAIGPAFVRFLKASAYGNVCVFVHPFGFDKAKFSTSVERNAGRRCFQFCIYYNSDLIKSMPNSFFHLQYWNASVLIFFSYKFSNLINLIMNSSNSLKHNIFQLNVIHKIRFYIIEKLLVSEMSLMKIKS